MLGAMIGDVVGSRFEWRNHKSKNFKLFAAACKCTDDSVMTAAIGKAVLSCKGNYTKLSEQAIYHMRDVGQCHKYCGYGGQFRHWIRADEPQPAYGSYGNGSAMRVSACGIVARSVQEAMDLSHKVTIVTHNHPEGLKGAEAVAVAVHLARNGVHMSDIRSYMQEEYYDLDFTIDGIRDTYDFDGSCQGTVPQALQAFFESADFEDAIRTAVSVGGDCDTLTAITGSIAAEYYGVPAHFIRPLYYYLEKDLIEIADEFASVYPVKIEKPILRDNKRWQLC